MIEIARDRLHVLDSNLTTTYSYERHKVGMIVRAPLRSVYVHGLLKFSASEDHLYRVSYWYGKPLIAFAFRQNGETITYNRLSQTKCTP